MLTAQVGAEGENVFGRVLVHRRVLCRTYHDDGIRRIANHQHQHAEQRSVEEAFAQHILPFVAHCQEHGQTACKQKANDDGHRATAHKERNAEQKHRQRVQHHNECTHIFRGAPNSSKHNGNQQENVDDKTRVETHTHHVDKEEFKPATHFDNAGNHTIEHGHHQQHRYAQRTERTRRVGVGFFLEIIDQSDGRQAKQIEQVDADGEAGEIEYQYQPTVGMRLVGMVFPFQDKPKHQGGEHGRVAINFALNGRKPERVAPCIGQGTSQAGSHDEHRLPSVGHDAVFAHQFAGQMRDGPKEKQNTEGRQKGRHHIDAHGNVLRIAGEKCEEVACQHKERRAGRVAHFQL